MTIYNLHRILFALAVACLLGLAITADPCEQPDGSLLDVCESSP